MKRLNHGIRELISSAASALVRGRACAAAAIVTWRGVCGERRRRVAGLY